MNKKLWWIIGIVLILIIALVALKKSGVIGKEEGVKVAVEKIGKRTIIETVSASGKVYPEDERKVSSDVSGEVVELNVQEGDSVRKGQVLGKVFADVLTSNRDRSASVVNQQQAQVSNIEAGLDAFEARLNQTKLAYDRQKKLYDDKVISRAEFELAESQYLSAKADLNAARQSVKGTKAGVESAKADLNAANKNLSRTTIISPMDGIVSLLAVKKGERVAGNQFSLGTEIMRVADMSKIEVRVDVGENDIPKVHIGDSAIIEVDAYNDRKFKGVVTQISSSSTSAQGAGVAAASSDVTNYKVYIRIDPASYSDLIDPAKARNLPFRPGMSASADIMTKRHENVLALPILAITTRDKNEKESKTKAKEEADKKKAQGQEVNTNNAILAEDMEEVVFVLGADGKVRKVPVRTDIQDNEYIEVLSGVKEGDQVVSAPYNTISKLLKNDMKVIVVPKDKVYETK